MKMNKDDDDDDQLEINEFPGGPYGFELVSRFCHNNNNNNNGRRIKITVSNVSLLHCCSLYLGIHTLLQQTESFLQDMFFWSWNDTITCLKSCEPLLVHADSCGLLQKLISALLSHSHLKSPNKSHWWFEDLLVLSPHIVEKIIRANHDNSLVLTKFLLHYLKRSKGTTLKWDYSGLADKAVEGVLNGVGKSAFSCRKLLWILRLVSGFGVSKEWRGCLERRIGEMLDQATLDDLMVSRGDHDDDDQGHVYDVNMVLRLIRIFVSSDDVMLSIERMKKAGRLIDKYLGEISPDHKLQISKFVEVAQSLPDFARDCFDGVYRAIDIYLQSHPRLLLEERSKLCRCLNYKKLSLEACKELAKNPKIPPEITVEALISQAYKESSSNESRMQYSRRRRVVELEKECSSDIRATQMLHLLNAPPTALFSTFPTTFC